MAFTGQRVAVPQPLSRRRAARLVLLACVAAGCGGSSTSGGDAGNNPSSAVSVGLAPSNQAQTIQVPQNSGPVTGTISVPPIAPTANASGDVTLTVQSGTSVSLEQATLPRQPTSSLRERSSDTTLPGGPYIFEMTLTAPFAFTMPAIPSLTLNLGSLGASNPNASYTVVLQNGSGPPQEFTETAVNDVLTFPGPAEPQSVAAGAVLTLGLVLTSNIPNGVDLDAGPAVVFVVDATATLYAFDAQGNVSAKATLPGTVGDLNGGNVAFVVGPGPNAYVYVTLGSPTNTLVAYTQSGLKPTSLGSADFSALNTPRGIVYDTNDLELYVGNGGSTITAYAEDGLPIATPGGFPGEYGPSGVAYDADHQTIWVANYVGNAGADFTIGTAEYNEDGTLTQSFDLSTQFLSPNVHNEPYSIGYCPLGTCASSTVAVGFIDDGSGVAESAVGIYYLDGGSAGVGPDVVKPYQLTFDSAGNLWIADKGGLIEWAGGGNIVPSGFTATLHPPIYGVFAQ